MLALPMEQKSRFLGCGPNPAFSLSASGAFVLRHSRTYRCWSAWVSFVTALLARLRLSSLRQSCTAQRCVEGLSPSQVIVSGCSRGNTGQIPDSLQLRFIVRRSLRQIPDAASFRDVSDVTPSAIEVECPNERFATRGAHEPRSLQHRSMRSGG